jgi:hypothetical protein
MLPVWQLLTRHRGSELLNRSVFSHGGGRLGSVELRLRIETGGVVQFQIPSVFLLCSGRRWEWRLSLGFGFHLSPATAFRVLRTASALHCNSSCVCCQSPRQGYGNIRVDTASVASSVFEQASPRPLTLRHRH